MQKIIDIYSEYKIMPNLQEHMLRVAAAASLICDNFDESLPTDDIIAACLLHDMGNIIKFNLSLFPQFTQTEGIEYWQKVQEEYFQKYGHEEHVATDKIAQEIGVSETTLGLINAVSFIRAPEVALSDNFGHKIIEYCDDRVTPLGVVSLEQRLADLRVRYAHRGVDTPERKAFENAVREMEKQIFGKCKIKPEDINDQTAAPIISELRNFVIIKNKKR